jgi:hypothetical protein
MVADPAALQLRLLQAFVEIASERSRTVVVPVPVELLRFLDRAPAPPARPGLPPRRPPRPPHPWTLRHGPPAGVPLTVPLNTAPKTPLAS